MRKRVGGGKMLTKERITALVLAFMLAVPIVVPLGATAAFANNSIDTIFTFNFGNGGPWTTQTRYKEDYSSSWIYCTNGSASFNYCQVSVFARERENGPSTNVGSPWVTLHVGESRYLINYVRERGYRWAFGLAKPPVITDVYTMSGLYSGDSI
jgi:hypothetical protein